MKATLTSTSRKLKHTNSWDDVYVDQYTVGDEEFIKVFVTKHDLDHKHFNLNGIVIGDVTYRILEKTFEEKRPKYAVCKVVKESASGEEKYLKVTTTFLISSSNPSLLIFLQTSPQTRVEKKDMKQE